MEKIKWGLLGTAKIARQCTIPGMLQAENCELTAVAGRSLEKAQAFQREYGFRKAYGSYEELLADPEIQAVYIPLPNNLHPEWSIKALQAKKHVLCEKPLAPTAAQAEAMIRAAEENGVYLMEAFAYLHSPLIRAIREEIDSGAIGKLNYIESEFSTPGHDPSNIRMHKDTCGGSFYDLGCYCTSLILWMFGQDPESVHATAEFSDQGIDTMATGFLKFPGGGRGAFTCGMDLAPGRRIDRMAFYGTTGSILTDAQFNQDGALRYTLQTKEGTVEKTVKTPHNYGLEVEQLGRCVMGLETPHVSNAFSLRNSKTMDRVLKEMQY